MASEGVKLAASKANTICQLLSNCALAIFHAWSYFSDDDITLGEIGISPITHFTTGAIHFCFNKPFVAHRGHFDKRNKQIVWNIMNFSFRGIQIAY